MKKMLSYFIQGLLLLAPFAVTIYVVVALFTSFDNMANDVMELLIGRRIVGLGFLVLVVFITIIGYVSSLFIVRPLFSGIDKLILKTPGIKIIYSGLKDLIAAFASDKKKFNKPALITLNHHPVVQRMGFITQSTMDEFHLIDKVAVYIPHSYNFSGNLFIIDAKEVTPLDISSTDALKFMVSGGIADVEE